MADIKPKNPINVEDRLKNLSLYSVHPQSIATLTMGIVSDITDGRVENLEPSTPIALCLETSALMAAFAIQEYVFESRKLYPKLANNEQDLYKHMSDKDYLDRFARPAFANVTFNISWDDFKTRAYQDPKTKDTIFTLARNTRLKIEDYVFSLPSPIVIRRTENGVLDVRYDNNLTDDIFPLTTDFLDWRINDLVVDYETYKRQPFLTFTAKMPEVDLEQRTIPVEFSKYIRGTMNFKANRKFYYFKVYYTTDDKVWKEMLVTHTEEVFDIKEPTCIINVLQDSHQVEFKIPPVYTLNNTIGTKLRLVVYTTKGETSVNFGDFPEDDFKCDYNKIFPELETNETTQALNVIPKSVFIRETVIGGRGRKSFDDLKTDVINNNLRPVIPVTNNQVTNIMRKTALTPVRNHDTVTDREYLVKTRIPSNVSRYKIARMALDLIQIKTSINDLLDNKNKVIRIKEDILVLPMGTIFEVNQFEGLRILTKEEANYLEGKTGQDVIKEVNSKNYMSLYYHCVLDGSLDSTEVRAYELKSPIVSNVNFKNYNATTKFGVNVVNSIVQQNNTGYEFTILAGSKVYNEKYSIYNITPYLVYIAENGARYFIEGRLSRDTPENPVFVFYLESVKFIDRKDKIHITNFKAMNGETTTIGLDLEQDLEVLYVTNDFPDTFKPSVMDEMLYGTYLTGDVAVVTHETHTIKFGERLKRLYTRVHTSVGDDVFQHYKEDVILRHKKVRFNSKNEIIGMPNDIVYDTDGKEIIEHHKGDIVVNEDGTPVIIDKKDRAVYLNLLLMDYKIFIGNGLLINEYKEHVRLSLNTLILNNMVEIQSGFLDETLAFLTVPNGVTEINVVYDGKRGYIKSSQPFKFTVYVTERVHSDMTTRKGIETTTKETLDEYLTDNKKLSHSELITLIRDRIKEFARSIKLHSFTELNAEYIEIQTDNAEVSVRKRLVSTPNGYDVIDDIDFDFVIVDKKEETSRHITF